MSGSVSVERQLSEAELDQLLKTADSGERARRLGFVKNLYLGDSISEAISREGRSESTGYRWVHRWNDGGLDALLPSYGGGRPAKLSESEVDAFLECIERRQPVSTATVESILQTEFGVEYAAEYLPRKLEEVGLVYRPAARETVDRQAVLEAVDWDEKTPVEQTRRVPYDGRASRATAGWIVSE
ncbi:helix-turn-helix domain-containing protein [Halobacterium salinarum]|uniref:helix-turn-helix domain-containing protein n=1 Tax=Halobacterium salinarum TaxID=2242 RepID=UPI0033130079